VPFAGIVHLHGSLDQPSTRLVVTNGDFGRAYLTDAWAARFLYEMYRTYTVLFIGYSHSDWMMDYLARGLAPDTRRYALVPQSDATTDWSGLGVVEISYPVVDHDHAALTEVIEEWASQTQAGLLEHEARLRAITAPPVVDRAQAAYIRRFLLDETLDAAICRNIAGKDWPEWLLELPERHGAQATSSGVGGDQPVSEVPKPEHSDLDRDTGDDGVDVQEARLGVGVETAELGRAGVSVGGTRKDQLGHGQQDERDQPGNAQPLLQLLAHCGFPARVTVTSTGVSAAGVEDLQRAGSRNAARHSRSLSVR
jgi:SIR2-like domain